MRETAPPAAEGRTLYRWKGFGWCAIAVALMVIGGYAALGLYVLSSGPLTLFHPAIWLAGVAMLWLVGPWRTWQKVLGTLIWPISVVGVLEWIAGSGGGECSQMNGGRMVCGSPVVPEWIMLTVAPIALIAPLVIGAYLLLRTRQPSDAGHVEPAAV